MPKLSRSFLVAAAVLAALLAVAAIVTALLLFVDRSRPDRRTTVVVVRGATFGAAAVEVERAGVAPAWRLRLLERLRRHDGQIAAGAFVFAPHLTAEQVYAQLKSAALPIARWLTIPEGFTAREIDARLRTEGFAHAHGFASYALHHAVRIDGERTRSLEGYLFPSTYLIPDDADAAAVAAVMVGEFRRRLPPDAPRRAAVLHATLPEIVTVASLIEREAKRDDERPLMAGVYYHRLRLGMPLEVDASLEYAFASHHSALTVADLANDTPYNTYKHFGLPPTPIANPGLPSILAALHPTQTAYLYYVYRGGGRHAFAATLEEHDRNVARYLR